MPITKIKTGFVSKDIRHAAFVAFYTEHKIFQGYDQSSEFADQDIPLLLFIHRWDGLTGFPGGMGETDETPSQTAKRETKEELNFDIEIERLVPVCSHDIGKIHTHLFAVKTTFDELKSIVAAFPTAEHAFIETSGVSLTQMRNYPGNALGPKGFSRLIQGQFATSVREELAVFCSVIGWTKKYDLQF